jgi:hypothetical protein
MEGMIMLKAYIIIIVLLTIPTIQAKKTPKYIPGIYYYKKMFGTIHRNLGNNSETLSTISCGQPLRVIMFQKKWGKIKAGPYLGYIKRSFISSKKPPCFQDSYPKFFDLLNLELSEIYYWGRLYDQYVIGKSRIK